MIFIQVVFVFIGVVLSLGNSSKSHYDVLRVKKNANLQQIKTSYRRLAKELHPDKNKNNPRAKDQFIEVSNAYEILSDDQKRSEYDQTLQFGTSNHHNGHNSHHPNHHAFQRGFHHEEEEPMYAFRTPDGRIYFTTKSNFERSNMGQQYYSSTFQMDFSEFPLIGGIFAILLLAMQVLLCCSPIIGLWAIGRFLSWLTTKPTIMPPRKPRDSSSNTNINRNTSTSTDTGHCLLEKTLPAYVPGLKTNHLISIIPLHISQEIKLIKLQKKFLRDPINFFRMQIYPEENQDQGLPYIAIALSKSGLKWTGCPKEVELEKWIVQVLNGEVAWESTDSLPGVIDIAFYKDKTWISDGYCA
eukprot:gene7197-14674_t